MTARIYISNICPAWPIERQQAAIAAELPDWSGARVFRDDLDPKQRQAHRDTSLVERGNMLRRAGRPRGGEAIYAVAACLAWTEAGLLDALAQAAQRGATVHLVDAGVTLAPSENGASLRKALAAFAASRRRQAEEQHGRRGGTASGQRRWDAAEAKAQIIKARWGDPTWRTDDLCREAGLTYLTAKRHLGSRPIALAATAAAQKRAAKRQAKAVAA